MTDRPVLVTTAHRGVFFGYTSDPANAKEISLRRCRMAVQWSADCRGVLGLAAAGPTAGCRISPPADCESLRDITGIWTISEAAAQAWETAPWNK